VNGKRRDGYQDRARQIGYFVLHIAGAAALLIWAVRLVRTGVERAFSVPLRRWLRHSARNRMVAAGTGLGTAVLLQSSTAVAILIAGFIASGALTGQVGLAILLGADVGSAIVTQLLLVQQSWMVPLLLLGGVVLFMRGERRSVRQAGRILIGLALIFVSLGMIRAATEPLRDSAAMVAAMRYLGGDLLTAFAIGALFAWAVHSSVAAVLLFVTLAASATLPVGAAVAMVLGANLGGSFIAFVLTLKGAHEARLVILSNLVLRGGGAVLALMLTGPVVLSYLGATPGRQVINLHLAYNLIVALLALPLTGPAIRLMRVFLPAAKGSSEALDRISALDPSAIESPDKALACATREILRIGEEVEVMLRSVIGLYRKWDDATAAAIRKKGDMVGRMHFDTKLYLAKLHRGKLGEQTARRSMELSTISVNLEAASDAIARTMLGLAKRMDSEGLSFSDAGWEELCDFHDRVLSNTQAALNVLMTHDVDAARSLVEEKANMRLREQKLQRAHINRLRKGKAASIETSNIHQETLRELKHVNTCFTMIAYPILAETGDLLSSRLRNQAAE